VIPEHEISSLNFEAMITGGGKMAIEGENAAEFEPANNMATARIRILVDFLSVCPSKALKMSRIPTLLFTYQ
jgi:hypothetical protein